MSTPPAVSVIIPTYNRKNLLRETLDSLARQTYPSDNFEVIIVDDGSTDGTAGIESETFPFVLRYLWQKNQGDAEARNVGALQSQADILVFLDDDILVEPGYLAHLIEVHDTNPNGIVSGTCKLMLEEKTAFSASMASAASLDDKDTAIRMPFTEVYSNNMSLKREVYFKIGMMQGLDFPGSSMWCDLDFGYRAHRQGFEVFRSTKAICWHRDYTVRNLETYTKRMRIAGYRAVMLFQKYPELLAHVPMFADKTPILWGQDSPGLIVCKLTRVVASSRLALWIMEKVVHALEKRPWATRLLQSLYRFIVGGHIFQGYRQGLNEFTRMNNAGDPSTLP